MARSLKSRGEPRNRFVRDIRHGIAITKRDEALLVELAHCRVMTGRQMIARGYFPSISRANIRLRALFDHGYVRRRFEPEGSYGAEALYHVGLAATDLLTRHLEIERKEVQRLCRTSVAPLFLAHSLKVVDTRIGFEECSSESAKVAVWRTESQAFHEYALPNGAGGWTWHSLRPDAFALLALSGKQVHGFIEVDLGHVSAKAFEEKITRYREYWSAGIFKQTYDAESFAVFVITTGHRRLEHLVKLVKVGGKPAIRFTTQNLFMGHGPFAKIWSSNDHLTEYVTPEEIR